MKILFLVPELFCGVGGIQVYNNHLVKTILELGHTLSIVSINDTQDQVDHFPPGIAGFSPCGKNKFLRKVTFAANTIKHSLNFKPDLILCGHVNFSPLCYIVSKFLGKEFIVLTYGIDVWNLNHKLKIKALKAAETIISISNYTKNRLVGQIPEINNKVKILHNAIDDSKFCPKPKSKYLMEKWNLNANDKVIFTVARLSTTEKHKGYDKVIYAMKDLVMGIPDAKYLLAGRGGDIERISKMIKDYGLENKVILTGFIQDDELVDYYNLCDVFIMPSKKEGFGFVFIEALACGKPVICGNQDGSVDAVLNGEIGVLVDPDDNEDIKNAIVKVLKGEMDKKLTDPEYLRKRVIEEYGAERFRERVKSLIESTF